MQSAHGCLFCLFGLVCKLGETAADSVVGKEIQGRRTEEKKNKNLSDIVWSHGHGEDGGLKLGLRRNHVKSKEPPLSLSD